MDKALILRFYELLDDDIARDLRKDLLDVPNPTFIQVMDKAAAKYGVVTPAQQIANRNRLVAMEPVGRDQQTVETSEGVCHLGAILGRANP